MGHWSLTTVGLLVVAVLVPPGRPDPCPQDVEHTGDLVAKYGEHDVIHSSKPPLDWIKEKPELSAKNLEKDSAYLVLMIDPDAPGLKCGQAYLHWQAVFEVKKNDESQLVETEKITEYMPPNPPSGQEHRYQLLGYKLDKGHATFTDPSSRSPFDLGGYLKDKDVTSTPEQPDLSMQFLYKQGQ